jgi:hypothetical protein
MSADGVHAAVEKMCGDGQSAELAADVPPECNLVSLGAPAT